MFINHILLKVLLSAEKRILDSDTVRLLIDE